MGLPAFKERFEILTAQTRSRSEDVSRAGEIVSAAILDLARSSKRLVKTLGELRVLLITGEKEIVRAFRGILDPTQSDMTDCAVALALVKPFAARTARPYFSCPDGTSAVTTAERLETALLSKQSDRRHARKFGKHIREAAEECEGQRKRFMLTVNAQVKALEESISERFDPADFRKAYSKEIGRQSIERFPVINAYLAR